MHVFTVWAPRAHRVDLELTSTGDRVPLAAAGDGWWHGHADNASHGTDYAFRLDGGDPLPDPRSARQPAGVHGPSRVFDASRHDWTDAAWPGRDTRGAVTYELHVGTFTAEGTLDAAAAHLPELVDLGVDVVALMPIAPMPGRHGWGYDGVELFAVHEPYGGPAALQRFVDAAHAAGLAVSLDLVYNHLGPEGNYLAAFGPYFTDRHHTPWGAAVNLDDEGSREVRRWICDNALRWLEDFHVDALRLDAVHALLDDSAQHLLAQLSDEVSALADKLGRPLSLVAESDRNDPRTVEPTSTGGLGMTAQWSDDLHHALHALLTGERQGYYVDFGGTDVVARTLTEVFRHAGDDSTFRGQAWGRPVDPARHRGHAFLGYLQTHDQVGNRAAGDRIGMLTTPGHQAAGAAIVLTSPFTPLLFMGEEWAASTPFPFFAGYGDEALARSVRDGRRREFADHGWGEGSVPDPTDPATRDAAVLDRTERAREPHARMHRWYRDLLALRRAEPQLADDDLARVRVDTGPTWLVVHRGAFRVVANLGAEPLHVALDGAGVDVVLAWNPVDVRGDRVVLPADSACVLRLARLPSAASATAPAAAPAWPPGGPA